MSDELTVEADRWLAAACDEFDAKQARLEREWLRQFERWEFNPTTGVLTLFHPDGSRSLATAEILGSCSPEQKTWEWAWNNPDLPAQFAQKGLIVQEVAKDLGLDYLAHGILPIIDHDPEVLSSYLCSIGVKAADAAGVFRGGDERLPVYFLVFDPT